MEELEKDNRGLSENGESHQLTIVQDEVSRPALRQTVMTTNCKDTNHTDVKPVLSPINTKNRSWEAHHIEVEFSLRSYFFFYIHFKTGKYQQAKRKGTRKGSITDVYTQKFDNTWLRHLNCLTQQKHCLSRRLVHLLCKPCCLRGDSLEFFRCQKQYLWRESTTGAFKAKAVSSLLLGFTQTSIR